MHLCFVPQPYDHSGNPSNVGSLLEKLLQCRDPFFREVWFVSAFVNQLGIVRLRPAIKGSIEDGAKFHFIIGIDAHSTTIEALQEIIALRADSKIVKNRLPDHTFHPKIYLFEAPDQRAELLIGSSNLTEGGTYRNYEINIQISYDLTGSDKALYQTHKRLLTPFTNPTGPTVKDLTEDLILTLAKREDIISEQQKRKIRRILTATAKPTKALPESPFGVQRLPSPPPLPPDFLSELLKRTESMRARKRRRRKLPTIAMPEIPTVNAFYVHLTKLQGPTIPGEPRIPKAARDIAPDFWGWPHRYRKRIERRGKRPRHYMAWKPKWRIADLSDPSNIVIKRENVRMYEYRESADFRFYSAGLKSMGADQFDIVRITRVDEADCVFQCELAKRGSPLHSEWSSYCTQPIRNSMRRFGYA